MRLVRAFSRCRHYEFPFEIKVVVRKDTLPQLEQIAIFAARMGAVALNFGHLLPTSDEFDHELTLTGAGTNNGRTGNRAARADVQNADSTRRRLLQHRFQPTAVLAAGRPKLPH